LKEAGTYFQADRDSFLLNSIHLKDLIETEVDTVPSNLPLPDLVQRFLRSKQNLFPLLDEHKKFAGIVLFEDLKDLLFDEKRAAALTAKDVSISPPYTLVLGEKMADVMQKFDDTWVWKLPVLSEKGAFIGFVSKKKIFTRYRQLLKQYSLGES
jgi:CIC family chloride channel protein